MDTSGARSRQILKAQAQQLIDQLHEQRFEQCVANGGFDDDGFDQFGFDKDGYDRNGYNFCGVDRWGNHRPDGFKDPEDAESPYEFQQLLDAQNEFIESTRNAIEFDEDGFGPDGYDRDGFYQFGYDREGFGRDGIHFDGIRQRDDYSPQGWHFI